VIRVLVVKGYCDDNRLMVSCIGVKSTLTAVAKWDVCNQPD
jgi:hypothetical protein